MRRSVLSLVTLVAAAVAATTVLPLASATAGPADPAQRYDFNPDGFPELVTGLPTLTVRQLSRSGGVVVYRSSADGVSSRGRVITQRSKGVPGAAEKDDAFGSSVASADFDRDGYADLAIGSENETVGGMRTAGRVTVLYGSPRGLRTQRSWSHSPGQGLTRFGSSLVAADFTGDGYPDLAVGASGAGMWSDDAYAQGAVEVLRGGRHGLSASAPVLLPGPRGDWYFGSELAAGRLHRGARSADLVVAAEGEPWQGTEPTGSVTVATFRADATGELLVRRRVLHDVVQPTALAVADIVGGRHREVVVGEPSAGQVGPREDTSAETGRLLVYRGSRSGPSTDPVRVTEATRGVPGNREYGDHFGEDVVAGDVDRDGKSDLVVWAGGDRADIVLHGRRSGIARTGNRWYAFGASPRLFDLDRDGRRELTVVRPAGVTVHRHAGTGFTSRGRQLLPLDALDYPVVRPGNRWSLDFVVLGRLR